MLHLIPEHHAKDGWPYFVVPSPNAVDEFVDEAIVGHGLVCVQISGGLSRPVDLLVRCFAHYA
ncbi:MAG: hypothetical protein MZV70_53605 [Desulfobacterales bacterium]|nr:hypothetical protein [Desulfobacterales bacterium]